MGLQELVTTIYMIHMKSILTWNFIKSHLWCALFCQASLMKFRTDHGGTAVLSAKFQKDLSIKDEAMDKEDFVRFLFETFSKHIIYLVMGS